MDGHDTTHSHHQSILLKVEKELMVSVIESISYGLFSLKLRHTMQDSYAMSLVNIMNPALGLRELTQQLSANSLRTALTQDGFIRLLEISFFGGLHFLGFNVTFPFFGGLQVMV